MHGLKDKPVVGRGAELGGSHGQAQLKWHIETWRYRRRPVQLDPGEIMDRIAATTDQIEDLVQTVAPTGNLDCGAGLEIKVDQARYVSKIETAESIVIGDIQEDGLLGIFRRMREHERSLSSAG